MTPLQEKPLYCVGYGCSSSQRGLGGALGAGGLDQSSAKELLPCRVLKWRSAGRAQSCARSMWLQSRKFCSSGLRQALGSKADAPLTARQPHALVLPEGNGTCRASRRQYLTVGPWFGPLPGHKGLAGLGFLRCHSEQSHLCSEHVFRSLQGTSPHAAAFISTGAVHCCFEGDPMSKRLRPRRRFWRPIYRIRCILNIRAFWVAKERNSSW